MDISKEELERLPAHLKMRLGYLKLALEKAKKQEEVSHQELILHGIELNKQLKQEEKDSLSD